MIRDYYKRYYRDTRGLDYGSYGGYLGIIGDIVGVHRNNGESN